MNTTVPFILSFIPASTSAAPVQPAPSTGNADSSSAAMAPAAVATTATAFTALHSGRTVTSARWGCNGGAVSFQPLNIAQKNAPTRA